MGQYYPQRSCFDRGNQYDMQIQNANGVPHLSPSLGFSFMFLVTIIIAEVINLTTKAAVSSSTTLTTMSEPVSHGWIIELTPDEYAKYSGDITVIGMHGDNYVCEVTTKPSKSSDKDDEITMKSATDFSSGILSTQFDLLNNGYDGGIVNEDIDVEKAWERGHSGQNTTIAFLDDGLYWAHDAFTNRFNLSLSFNYPDNTSDPTPDDVDNDAHGTACAGVAAAAWDNECGSGVAPNATVSGIVILGSGLTVATWAKSLLFRNDAINIKSNSYGPSGCASTGCPFSYTYPTIANAVQEASKSGRGGLGTVFAFAAGNNGNYGGDVNFFDVAKLNYIIAVACTSYIGGRIYYSNRGTALMVNAPSAGKADSYMINSLVPGIPAPIPTGCTGSFSGTSASTPMVCGVVSLMLSANSNLTWRDVHSILALSSTKNDPYHWSWMTNYAGYHHSSVYGFGRINADAAVNMSKTWKNIPTQYSMTVNATVSETIDPIVSIPLQFSSNITFIEDVSLITEFTHSSSCDLEIRIQSPSNTTSKIKIPCIDSYTNTYSTYPMFSRQFFGESASGTWKVIYEDRVNGNVGTLTHVSLTAYGFIKDRTYTQSQTNGSTFQINENRTNFNIVNSSMTVTKGVSFSVKMNATSSVSSCAVDYYVANGTERFYLGSSSSISSRVTFTRFPSTIKSGNYEFVVHSQDCGFGDEIPITVLDNGGSGCSVSVSSSTFTINWTDSLPSLPYDGWEGMYILSVFSGDDIVEKCACDAYGSCTCSASSASSTTNLSCSAAYIGNSKYTVSDSNETDATDSYATYSTYYTSSNAATQSSSTSSSSSSSTNWKIYGSIIGVCAAFVISAVIGVAVVCVNRRRKEENPST